MARKPKKAEKPQVNAALEGFDIRVNEFGEIISTFNVQTINTFLDDKVDDKKFRGIEIVKRLDPKEPEATTNEKPEAQED